MPKAEPTDTTPAPDAPGLFRAFARSGGSPFPANGSPHHAGDGVAFHHPGEGEMSSPSHAGKEVVERHPLPGRGEAPLPLPHRMFVSVAASAGPSILPYAWALPAAFPAPPVPEWMAARAEADRLRDRATGARAALEARIGPRGLTLGMLDLPSGRALPIRVASPEAAKRLWRRLNPGRGMDAERADLLAAVGEACGHWDAEAERAGVRELERRAAAARDRARALAARAA